MTHKPFNILMVCTGNICRSPMAEGLLRNRLTEKYAGKVAVSSAGTHALHGNPAQPHAVEVMREYGVDISRHRARLLASADLVLVMETFHLALVKKKSWPQRVGIRLLTEFDAHGDVDDVPDPMGEAIAEYRISAKIIDSALKGVVAHLERLLENN